MAKYRAAQAAELLGVSPDTIRRWAETGRLASTLDGDGKRFFDGVDIATAAMDNAGDQTAANPRAQSARNRFVGIVTNVIKDKVVAKVEVQAGPHRFVSLITREACDELELAPGVVVDAVIKATNVSVEIPAKF